MKKNPTTYQHLMNYYRKSDGKTDPVPEAKIQAAIQASKVMDAGVALYNMQCDKYQILRKSSNRALDALHLFTDRRSFNTLIHVDDATNVRNNKLKAMELALDLNSEDIMHFKLSYRCLMKTGPDSYQNMVHQYLPFELDREGRLWLLLLFFYPVSCHKKEFLAESMNIIDTRTWITVYKPQKCTLSARELEILKLIVKGKTSKEIAELLHISKRTVDNHRENMMNKTGTCNALELVSYAIALNLL